MQECLDASGMCKGINIVSVHTEVCVTVLIETMLSIMKFHPQEGFNPAGNILILKTKIITAALAFHWLQGEGHDLTFL